MPPISRRTAIAGVAAFVLHPVIAMGDTLPNAATVRAGFAEEDGWVRIPLRARPLLARDHLGHAVYRGGQVRILCLTGACLDDLKRDERRHTFAMIGGVYEVEEIDEDGKPWVSTSWVDDDHVYNTIAIDLDPHEFEVI